MKTTPTLRAAALLALTLLGTAPALAQEAVTLKVHHFLPAGSYANTMFIQPWCDKIARESANKLKCQIYLRCSWAARRRSCSTRSRTAWST